MDGSWGVRHGATLMGGGGHVLADLISKLADCWSFFRTWVADNNGLVSALSAAVTAGAAVVFGVYQVRIGRFTRQAALAAEAATSAAIRLEQPVVRLSAPELLETDEPITPNQTYGGTDLVGRPTRHMALATVKIANYGRTPCEIRQYRYGYVVAKTRPESSKYTDIKSPYLPRFLLVGEEITEHLDYPIELTEADVGRINVREASLWFFVSVTYIDFMDQSHIARGCWRWGDVYGDDLGLAGEENFGPVREGRAPQEQL
jgi:hypothetical protein